MEKIHKRSLFKIQFTLDGAIVLAVRVVFVFRYFESLHALAQRCHLSFSKVACGYGVAGVVTFSLSLIHSLGFDADALLGETVSEFLAIV